MSNLTVFYANGWDLVIANEAGEVFASIEAVAAMVSKHRPTICNCLNGKFKGVSESHMSYVEIPEVTGFKRDWLVVEDSIVEILCKYKPELTTESARLRLRNYARFIVGLPGSGNDTREPEIVEGTIVSHGEQMASAS